MWTSLNFEIYRKQFDFSSSEQGNPSYSALKIDGVDFLNIVEALNGEIGDNQVFQSIICNHCGAPHCSPGNWIAIRQSGDYIFFIPSFQELKEDPDSGEFEPPFTIKQKGAYWLRIDEYDRFKKLVPELSKLRSINDLTKFEMDSLLKWDTPQKMFGDFPNFQKLRKNRVLVVSDLDNETAFEILEDKFKEIENASEFAIKELTASDKVISFYLDDNSTTEWKVLCKTDDKYVLLLGGTFKVIVR